MNGPTLLAELQARGIKVAFTGDSLRFDSPRGAMRDLLPDVARLKPELIGLLQHGNAFAETPQTRQDNPASVSTFIRLNEFILAPANPKSEAERQTAFEVALATDIVAGAYFNKADRVWCIGWSTKGRHAWQRACLDRGVTLNGDGVPSIAAAEVIKWARERLKPESKRNR